MEEAIDRSARDPTVLQCDYLDGHPHVPGALTNGMVSRTEHGFAFDTLRADGLVLRWERRFDLPNAVVRSPVWDGRHRSVRRARAASLLWGVLDNLVAVLPKDALTEIVAIDAEIDHRHEVLRFRAPRTEVRAWLATLAAASLSVADGEASPTR